MKYLLAFLFIHCIFAQSPLTTLSIASNGSIAVFEIDPSFRGEDIRQLFLTLTEAPYKTVLSQVGIQTTRSGFIPNVTSITPTTHSTVLIVAYRPQASLVELYTVVLVEQIVEMVYSKFPFAVSDTFTSTFPGGIITEFHIDMQQRGTDIRRAFTILNTERPYKKPLSSVGLQTTLAGPFYGPIVDGLIPDVQSIVTSAAPHGTLLIVTYQIGLQNYTIIVAPDQVYGINYSPM